MDQMTQIEAMIAVAGLVTGLVAFLRPFVEQLPVARPGAALHDRSLQALNVLLNLAGIVAVAVTYGTFNPGQWLSYVLMLGGQAAGAHVLYSVVKSSAASSGSGSVASMAAPAAPSDTMAVAAADATQRSAL